MSYPLLLMSLGAGLMGWQLLALLMRFERQGAMVSSRYYFPDPLDTAFSTSRLR